METEISGRLLITGDLHGDTAALTMITRQLREGDALFVAGDFGFVFWDNRDEHVFLDDVDRFLQKINGYIIFADGNHENHRALNKFPVEQWNNARVHMIRSRIIHVLRGEVLCLKGKRIFCFGGAFSIDRACGDCGVATKEKYVEILEFTHFVEFFSFRKIGENHKEKSLVKKVTVVVALDLGTGNTKNLEYENE